MHSLRCPFIVGCVGYWLTLNVLSSSLAQTPSPVDSCLQGHLANTDIHESSGLARSQLRHDMFWTHNDSGDCARVFAVDAHGNHIAECRIPGAQSIDWEDIASFTHHGKPYLLIADVGDNGLQRDEYQIYVVTESETPGASLPLAATWRFRYESGPQNCEGVAVDTDRGEIVLVGKATTSSSPIFVIDMPARLEAAEPLVARQIGSVHVTSVTGLDISPDGRNAVLLTYFDATEFRRSPGEDWSKALSRRGRRLRVPPRIQGESVCYDRQGSCLWLTSEKLPTPLFRFPLSEGRVQEPALDQMIEQAGQRQ
jgi:hypothetical protein